jgi:ParB family chromosome partitioning protein
MAKNKSRLGRGLSSLLNVSDASAEVEAETPRPLAPVEPAAVAPPSDGELFHVELSKVVANPHQPRRTFEPEALQGLADSLKNSGLIQPIVVRQATDGYELVAGERRWRAAQLAGLTHLPALLRRVDALEQAQLALIENIHRADLNPLERALAYRSLMTQLGATQEELAGRLGEDRSSIANHLRLLDLCEPARQMVASGKLSLGHAKLLAGIHDLLGQQSLAEQAVAQQLSVRQLEQLIKSARTSKPVPSLPMATSAHIADLERRIGRDLEMRVQVRQAGKKGQGRLVIHYGSLDQFDELLNRLGVRTNE